MKFVPSNITAFHGKFLQRYHGQTSLMDVEYCAHELFMDDRLTPDQHALLLEHLRQIEHLFDQATPQTNLRGTNQYESRGPHQRNLVDGR